MYNTIQIEAFTLWKKIGTFSFDNRGKYIRMFLKMYLRLFIYKVEKFSAWIAI